MIGCASLGKVNFNDAVKSVLRIGSAHNKGGPADINIAQISHLSNFSVINFCHKANQNR